MKIPYEKFEELYLGRARNISCETNAPEVTTKELCKVVYNSLNEEELKDNRKVNFALAERYYSDFAQNVIDPTPRVYRLIYGEIENPEQQKWIRFEECLSLLKPILLTLPLFDRLIAALYLVGWRNNAIAELLNENLEQFSDEIQSVQTLAQIDRVLAKLRMSFRQRLSSLDDNGMWLSDLIQHKGHLTVEFESWQVLKNFSSRPQHLRFARGRNPDRDKFGRLRDHWDQCKQYIRQKLTQESLFQKDSTESNNEKYPHR